MITSLAIRRTASTILRLFLVGLLLIAWAGSPRAGYSAPAATNWYVAITGNNSYSCLTTLKPCEHIQAAIDKAASGDTVNIAAGTYNERLEILDKGLTLQGQGAAATIIDGQQQGTVLSISSGSPRSVTVSGLTVQNGQAGILGGGIASQSVNVVLTIADSTVLSNTAQNGGGIFNQGVLLLRNVTLRANMATGSEGGAIYNNGFGDLNGVTIVNNQASRGGGISNVNVLTITSSVIDDNRALGNYAGGIFNRGTPSRLTLVNSVVSRNQAIGTDGGGMVNEGLLISSGSIISGNKALGSGGGIYNSAAGRVTLDNVTLDNNTSISPGGGFFNNGEATLADMTVRNNQASQAGGGLYNDAEGKLTVDTGTVISNTTTGDKGGGIGNIGVLTVTRSTLIYNVASVLQGGGLSNAGTAQLTKVTVSNNTATAGGGIDNLGVLVANQSALIYNTASTTQGGGLNNAGTAQLTNVTVSDNTATAGGGGIHNLTGTLSIQFSTISYNSAPALNRTNGSVSVGNSLLVQSTGNACNGTITSADYNVDSGNSCGFAQVHDLINTNPQLGPLRDNGGNSLTRAIGFGSPAQDTAVDPCPLTVDQRGIARPQFDICDRGAYEVAGYSNPNPIDIAANQCITSLLTINDQFAVGRLLTGVNLTYGDRAQLTIRLLAPGSSRARLLGPAANSGQNLDTLFDDSAAQSVPPGDQNIASPFYENVYKPATPLQQFVGVGVKGTWKLEVCNSGPSTGTLNRWALVVPEISNFKVFMPIIRRNK
jgi:subtilisin-like proprotein convertase family protein